jgi:GH35 family endo-1,4-beta-xylanase
VKFQVFSSGKVVDEFSLVGAYLFGTDGIAVRRAQITCKKGLIECSKPNLGTAGMALLWPVDGFGKVLLPTTCLPERVRPYNLNVEIVRAKLMQIVNKQEEWSLFSEAREPEGLMKEAQGLFIAALQNISDAPLASKLADESLKRALSLGEKLAVGHARTLFEARNMNHGFGRGCLGCRLDLERVAEGGYLEKILEIFGLLTVPVNWGRIETEKGRYDFGELDGCLNLLARKKVVLCAGPLLCFSPKFLPQWLLQEGVDFEQIREAAYKFVLAVVARYSPNVRIWRAVSGLNASNHFGFSFEQVLEMTRAASMAVKAASERAIKIVEIVNPWGEYYADRSATIPPLVYADMIIQSGVPFDGFALQVQIGRNESGMHVRDMMQMSAVLDYFAPLARPLYVTDVQVPSRDGKDANLSGLWHQRWDQNRQGKWLEQFYQIALSKPFVESVSYANVIDSPDNIVADSGLMTDKLEPKKSFGILKKLHGNLFSR